jgi:hypothetical protein
LVPVRTTLIAERRAAPNWSQRVATVPTAVRESRIEEDWDWQSENLSGIAVPTLLLTGSETPPELAEVTSVTAAAIRPFELKRGALRLVS